MTSVASILNRQSNGRMNIRIMTMQKLVRNNLKGFGCGGQGHKSYQCPKRKNQTKGVVNHLGLKEIVGNVVRGRIYTLVNNQSVECQYSLIHAKGIISTLPFTILIDTRSTHSFISLEMLAKFNLSIKKLEDPQRVKMENGANMWINQVVDGCIIDLEDGIVEYAFMN